MSHRANLYAIANVNNLIRLFIIQPVDQQKKRRKKDGYNITYWGWSGLNPQLTVTSNVTKVCPEAVSVSCGEEQEIVDLVWTQQQT